MYPNLQRNNRQVDYSRLQAMVPGLAEDNERPDDFGGNQLMAQAAEEQKAAILGMHRAAAKPPAGQQTRGKPLAEAHGSSQSALDARFDAMEDESDDDERLELPIASARAQSPAKLVERSRSSLLREGDNWFNNMRDSEQVANDQYADETSDPGQRLSIDVEHDGGLEEDLQNIPHDMRDFPGADILFQEQRRRMPHEGT